MIMVKDGVSLEQTEHGVLVTFRDGHQKLVVNAQLTAGTANLIIHAASMPMERADGIGIYRETRGLH